MACATTGTFANVCPSTQTTCTNLQCNLDKCSGGAETSISGTVYDPAGLNPLYNVLLYVPNTKVDPIPQGVSCNTCNSPISGTPVAAGLSDATGHFVIHNAPHGTNVPLVIQIGKWRRQVTLPQVIACQDNPFNDPQTFRLPQEAERGGPAPDRDLHRPRRRARLLPAPGRHRRLGVHRRHRDRPRAHVRGWRRDVRPTRGRRRSPRARRWPTRLHQAVPQLRADVEVRHRRPHLRERAARGCQGSRTCST